MSWIKFTPSSPILSKCAYKCVEPQSYKDKRAVCGHIGQFGLPVVLGSSPYLYWGAASRQIQPGTDGGAQMCGRYGRYYMDML